MLASLLPAFAAIAALQLCAAQTFTSCDPTKKTCPADPALGKTVTVDFTKGATDQFTLLAGTTLTYGADGAHFTIAKSGQAPTIVSNWYMFFGRVDVVMKSAPGVGIVSSFVMESDDLDEIDFEWLGGSNNEVESNYFGKGDTTTYDRAVYHTIAPPEDAFHTYSVDWNADRIQWLFDGAVLRTLTFAQAPVNRYPQTPMQVRIGNWAGGDASNPQGTRDWAGGLTDYSQGPFTMVVKSITASDGTTSGSQYVYSDLTGDYHSIKAIGNSGGSNPGSGASSSVAAQAVSQTSSKTSSPSASASTSISATASTSSSPSSSSVPLNGTIIVQSGLQTSTISPATTAKSGTATTGSSQSGTSAASTTPKVASAADSLNVNRLALTLLGVIGLAFFYL